MNTLELYKQRIRRVMALFSTCRPSAIIWRVITVRVVPFNRHSFCRFAHVVKEVAKILPSLANFYSLTNVVLGTFSVRQPAAGDHSAPDSVNARARHAMSLWRSFAFCGQASTGHSSVGREKCGNNIFGVSAIASAKPQRETIFRTNTLYRNESSKSHTFQVEWFHNLLRLIFATLTHIHVNNVMVIRRPRYSGVMGA